MFHVYNALSSALVGLNLVITEIFVFITNTLDLENKSNLNSPRCSKPRHMCGVDFFIRIVFEAVP